MHPAVLQLLNDSKAQKCYRCAWDGEYYTKEEFDDWFWKYSEAFWDSAPHFNSLSHFCRVCLVDVVTTEAIISRGFCHFNHNGLDALVSSALFGIWLPGCLLLIDVHHLAGKLNDSRLAPAAFHPDIWDQAWVIKLQAPVSNHLTWAITTETCTLMILDYCTDLMGSGADIGMLGRLEMRTVAQEFITILDGKEPYNKNNLILALLGVKPWIKEP